MKTLPKSAHRSAARTLIACVASLIAGVIACSGGSSSPTLSPCNGKVTCACYPNGTCDQGLSCASGLCVVFDAGTSGGGASSGSSSGTGSSTSSGGEASVSSSSGSGGADASSSSSSSSSSGSSASGSSSGSSGGTGDTCNSAPASVVDNFFTCDMQICNVGGRSGTWYSFASVDVNQTFAVSAPPTGWADRSCAAWSTGGPVNGVTAPSTYAGIGALLASGGPVNLSAYTGVAVKMESGQLVNLVVKDNAGGYFGSSALGGGTGTQSYMVNFAALTKMSNSQTNQLDLTQATAFEFDAVTPTSYGFAIHLVTLY